MNGHPQPDLPLHNEHRDKGWPDKLWHAQSHKPPRIPQALPRTAKRQHHMALVPVPLPPPQIIKQGVNGPTKIPTPNDLDICPLELQRAHEWHNKLSIAKHSASEQGCTAIANAGGTHAEGRCKAECRSSLLFCIFPLTQPPPSPTDTRPRGAHGDGIATPIASMPAELSD